MLEDSHLCRFSFLTQKVVRHLNLEVVINLWVSEFHPEFHIHVAQFPGKKIKKKSTEQWCKRGPLDALL